MAKKVDKTEKMPGKAGAIVTYALATLMAGGAGAGAGFLMPSGGTAPAAALEGEPPQKGAGQSRIVVTPLEPMLTNLAHPAGTWVRLELSLLSDTALMPEEVEGVSQDLLAFVRTARLSHMEGPSGFLTFREALDDRARFATDGKARRVLIRTILFE